MATNEAISVGRATLLVVSNQDIRPLLEVMPSSYSRAIQGKVSLSALQDTIVCEYLIALNAIPNLCMYLVLYTVGYSQSYYAY